MEWFVFAGVIGLLLLILRADNGDADAAGAVRGLGGGLLVVLALAALCAVLALGAGVDPFALAGGAR